MSNEEPLEARLARYVENEGRLATLEAGEAESITEAVRETRRLVEEQMTLKHFFTTIPGYPVFSWEPAAEHKGGNQPCGVAN